MPRTVDAALRRSIPVVNPVSKEILDKIEDAAFLLRIPQRKPCAPAPSIPPIRPASCPTFARCPIVLACSRS